MHGCDCCAVVGDRRVGVGAFSEAGAHFAFCQSAAAAVDYEFVFVK